MFGHKDQAQGISQQVDTLLAGEPLECNDPLLDAAGLLAKAAPEEPPALFYQNLRRHLLYTGNSLESRNQERSLLMWKRLAAAGMAALLVIAAFWMAWPRTLNAEQVLARAAQTTAAEPGQIIYQVYSSGGSLYREWQRLQTAPDGTLLSVEVLTIRYAKHDTAFEAPLEWIFSGPDRMCRWPLENTMSAPPDNRDAEGCRVVAASPETTTETSVFAESSAPGYEFTEAADPALRDQIQETLREASDAPGTVEVATIKTIQDQIESLQAASGTVTVVQMQLENRPVYAIEDTQLTSDSAGGSVLRTLYVDQKTFLPAGLSYQAQRSDGEIITWSALVMDYRVLNAAELDFDPFIWPPTQTP